MSNSLKAIMLAAGIVITLAVVTIGFIILGQAKDTANEALEELSQLEENIKNSSVEEYDGMEVKGNVVKSYVASHKSEYTVVVTTKLSTRTYTSDVPIVKEEESGDWINPSGIFACTVAKNENGAINTITFVQQ